jgi:ankyrin repeat protein
MGYFVDDDRNRELINAAAKGKYREVLQSGADVNGRGRQNDEYGNALQAASAKGYKDIAILLLDRKALVNADGGTYGSALQAASANGHKDIVELLLEEGAKVNSYGGKYDYSLVAATDMGHIHVVQRLLEGKANVNLKSSLHGTALHTALKRGHSNIATLLLDKGAEIDSHALHLAVARGNRHVLKLLLENTPYNNKNEVKPNSSDKEALYYAALEEATHYGNRPAVQLLKHKAEVDTRILSIALTRGHLGVLKLLLPHSVDCDADVLIPQLNKIYTDIAGLLESYS